MPAAQPSTPDLDHHAAMRAADRADMLRELAEIGMDLARALRGRMQALDAEEADAPSPGLAAAKAEVALAFSRVARGVRQTLALDARLERGERDRVERAQGGAQGGALGGAQGGPSPDGRRATPMPDGSSMSWRAPPPDFTARAAEADSTLQKFRKMSEVLRLERDTRRKVAARRALQALSGERPDWSPSDEIDWDDENELPVQASLAEKFVGACLDLHVDPGDVLRRGGRAVYDLGSSDPYFTQWTELLGDDDEDEDEPELEACAQGPPGSG